MSNKLAKYGKISYLREAKLAKQFDAFLPKTGKLLDIGSGGGMLAELIDQSTKLNVSIIDVVDHNWSNLKLELYDGKKLPFKDNSFDVCLIVFVLHHATNFEQIIKEALRVSKSRVIVIEDTPETRFAKAAWRHWDYLLNHMFYKDVAVAHSSRSDKQWAAIFKKCGAKVSYSRSFRAIFPVLASYPHTIFVLDK